MTNPANQYEIYAIRYATHDRPRSSNFLQRDPHDEGSMPMDYYVWLLRSGKRLILVDTGFNAETAARRSRRLLCCPIEALSVFGIDAAQITDVIVTHLHYDHAGNLDKLPNARFHIQDAEVSFATGRCMCFGALRHAYEIDDVLDLVRYVYADRVVFHAGDDSLEPGIELLRIGGHTAGLQSVRVNTERGWVVLASDASHYYENMQSARPFPIIYNLGDMLEGYRKLDAAADSPEHIVPGHDPDVLRRYPAWPNELTAIACLHQAPAAAASA
ncbi:N-acyl homoserine lactonase family protein [Paraburkholderia caffeinilytica]|uniref:N-acyl homoserine lactonase family protein n=1 Tax=Paraburkholderia caffeinilytica TaxID=1761016 RepID=UPI0038BD218C